MDTVIIAAASYLIYAMVVGFALVWLFAEDRRGKVELVVASILGLIVVLVLIKAASLSYWDPRPFVPVADGGDGSSSLIPHDPDNGFPSDHSAAAGLMATLVLLRRRVAAGIWFALGAVAVAWGRVAASVHHLTDVIGGLALGAVAAVIGVALMTVLVRRTRLMSSGPVTRWLRAGAGPRSRHRPLSG